MEEAIAALSLASCILQVIDFGTKVASTAFKVHQTLRRSKEDVDEVSQLRDVYKYLASTLDDIRTQPDRTGPPDTADEGIRKLAKDCEVLVKELLQTLKIMGFRMRSPQARNFGKPLKTTGEGMKSALYKRHSANIGRS